MHASIVEKRDSVIDACKQFRIARLDVFGSAARGEDFDPIGSDIDFLVDFMPGARVDTYFDLKSALEGFLGRSVDLIDRQAIEASRNYIRRRHILSRTETIDVA